MQGRPRPLGLGLVLVIFDGFEANVLRAAVVVELDNGDERCLVLQAATGFAGMLTNETRMRALTTFGTEKASGHAPAS